jgi:hypothetical protein
MTLQRLSEKARSFGSGQSGPPAAEWLAVGNRPDESCPSRFAFGLISERRLTPAASFALQWDQRDVPAIMSPATVAGGRNKRSADDGTATNP